MHAAARMIAVIGFEALEFGGARARWLRVLNVTAAWIEMEYG